MTISNGGATATVDGGDGKGISEEENDSYIPSDAGSGTGIHQVMNDKSQITNDVYDLMGRRIAIPLTGKIYILHGSKVVFK